MYYFENCQSNFRTAKKPFKLNYTFFCILKNIDNGQLCYYHASYKNNVMMDPHV